MIQELANHTVWVRALQFFFLALYLNENVADCEKLEFRQLVGITWQGFENLLVISVYGTVLKYWISNFFWRTLSFWQYLLPDRWKSGRGVTPCCLHMCRFMCTMFKDASLFIFLYWASSVIYHILRGQLHFHKQFINNLHSVNVAREQHLPCSSATFHIRTTLLAFFMPD